MNVWKMAIGKNRFPKSWINQLWNKFESSTQQLQIYYQDHLVDFKFGTYYFGVKVNCHLVEYWTFEPKYWYFDNSCLVF